MGVFVVLEDALASKNWRSQSNRVVHSKEKIEEIVVDMLMGERKNWNQEEHLRVQTKERKRVLTEVEERLL